MGVSRGLQIGCAAGSWAVGDAGGAVGLQPDLLAGSRCAVSGWAQHPARGRCARCRSAKLRSGGGHSPVESDQPGSERHAPGSRRPGPCASLDPPQSACLPAARNGQRSRRQTLRTAGEWHGAAQLGRGWWWKRRCRGRARGFQGGWWSPAVTPTDRNPAETFAPALSTPHATPSTPPHAACWSTPATPAAGRASGAEGSRS